MWKSARGYFECIFLDSGLVMEKEHFALSWFWTLDFLILVFMLLFSLHMCAYFWKFCNAFSS